jgi:hypothetical protein
MVKGFRRKKMKKNKKSEIKNPVIAYRPGLAKITGGARPALVLSQLLYWNKRAVIARPDKNGTPRKWVAKSRSELGEELGMTPGEIDTDIAKLVNARVVIKEIHKFSNRPILYFAIDQEKLRMGVQCELESTTKTPVQPTLAFDEVNIAQTTKSSSETTSEITRREEAPPFLKDPNPGSPTDNNTPPLNKTNLAFQETGNKEDCSMPKSSGNESRSYNDFQKNTGRRIEKPDESIIKKFINEKGMDALFWCWEKYIESFKDKKWWGNPHWFAVKLPTLGGQYRRFESKNEEKSRINQYLKNMESQNHGRSSKRVNTQANGLKKLPPPLQKPFQSIWNNLKE